MSEKNKIGEQLVATGDWRILVDQLMEAGFAPRKGGRLIKPHRNRPAEFRSALINHCPRSRRLELGCDLIEHGLRWVEREPVILRAFERVDSERNHIRTTLLQAVEILRGPGHSKYQEARQPVLRLRQITPSYMRLHGFAYAVLKLTNPSFDHGIGQYRPTSQKNLRFVAFRSHAAQTLLEIHCVTGERDTISKNTCIEQIELVAKFLLRNK